MKQVNCGFRSVRRFVFLGAVLGLAAWFATRVSAAPFTTNFAPLIVELQTRAGVLSNSLDKIEQKQFKTIIKLLAALDKDSTSLATDLKTAGKVTKSVVKAFPDDFVTNTVSAAPLGAIITTDLSDILDEVFDAFGSDVFDEITTLTDLIAGLPDGSIKTKAAASLAQAQLALAQAEAATDYASAAKFLASALKGALAGQATANSGGGGGGGDTFKALVIINGTNDNWIADTGTLEAEWIMGSGILDISGTRGGISGTKLSVALCFGFNGQTGTYALGNDCGGFLDFELFGFYLATTGSLQVAAFNSGAGTTSGTFWYEASDGVTTILVTNGMFTISNLLITP